MPEISKTTIANIADARSIDVTLSDYSPRFGFGHYYAGASGTATDVAALVHALAHLDPVAHGDELTAAVRRMAASAEEDTLGYGRVVCFRGWTWTADIDATDAAEPTAQAA